MFKRFRLDIIYALLTLACALYLYPLYLIQLFIWWGVYFFIKVKGKDRNLEDIFKKLFYLNICLYPILGLLIKLNFAYDLIPYSWNWMNRVEHALTAISTCIMLLPLFTYKNKELPKNVKVLVIAGLITIVGIRICNKA